MNQKNKQPRSDGGKHGNDPRKNDPTKQDERDNDATRIRPEKENKEKPAMPPDPGGRTPGNEGVEEPGKSNPELHKPEQPRETGKQQGAGINKGNNHAEPRSRNSAGEQDDSGQPVMKNYGKGL